MAWVVFAGLLIGRHRLGWRGKTAIKGTLTGFAFLLLGFYGSKFVLEFILLLKCNTSDSFTATPINV